MLACEERPENSMCSALYILLLTQYTYCKMHSLRFFSVTPPYMENKVLTRGPLVTYLYDI